MVKLLVISGDPATTRRTLDAFGPLLVRDGLLVCEARHQADLARVQEMVGAFLPRSAKRAWRVECLPGICSARLMLTQDMIRHLHRERTPAEQEHIDVLAGQPFQSFEETAVDHLLLRRIQGATVREQRLVLTNDLYVYSTELIASGEFPLERIRPYDVRRSLDRLKMQGLCEETADGWRLREGVRLGPLLQPEATERIVNRARRVPQLRSFHQQTLMGRDVLEVSHSI